MRKRKDKDDRRRNNSEDRGGGKVTIREGEEEEVGKKRWQEEGIHEYRKVEPDRINWPRTFRKKEAETGEETNKNKILTVGTARFAGERRRDLHSRQRGRHGRRDGYILAQVVVRSTSQSVAGLVSGSRCDKQSCE